MEAPIEHALEHEYVKNMPEHLKPVLLKKDFSTNIKTTNASPNKKKLETILSKITEHLADSTLDKYEILKTKLLAIESGIPESHFNTILQAELVKRELRKEEYRAVLLERVEQGCFPFRSDIRRELQELRQSLKLTNTEVEEVSHKILQKAKKQVDLTEEKKPKRKKFTLEISFNFSL